MHCPGAWLTPSPVFRALPGSGCENSDGRCKFAPFLLFTPPWLAFPHGKLHVSHLILVRANGHKSLTDRELDVKNKIIIIGKKTSGALSRNSLPILPAPDSLGRPAPPHRAELALGQVGKLLLTGHSTREHQGKGDREHGPAVPICPPENTTGAALPAGWHCDAIPVGTGLTDHLREVPLPLRTARGNRALEPSLSPHVAYFSQASRSGRTHILFQLRLRAANLISAAIILTPRHLIRRQLALTELCPTTQSRRFQHPPGQKAANSGSMGRVKKTNILSFYEHHMAVF